MTMKCLPLNVLSVAVAGLGILSATPEASLADEWGCEVLLCASSSNPSWPGVPSCHPPMERLIVAMSGLFFEWPTCPEAGTGAPGYEKYLPCKDGYTATHLATSRNDTDFGDLNACQKSEDVCGGGLSRSNYSTCMRTDVYVRSLRDQPYYFDLKSNETGEVTRHYFSLSE